MAPTGDTTGFLRPADRRYLAGESEYSTQSSESERKQKIREHVRAALKDFVFLVDHWDEDQLYKTFDELETEDEPNPVTCVQKMIALSYIGLNKGHTDVTNPVRSAHESLQFHHAARNGIKDGKQHFGTAPETLLLSSNSPLWELPDLDELGEQVDYDAAGKKNDIYQSMENGPEEYISKSFADLDYRWDITAEIFKILSRHREQADFDLLDFSYPRP